MSDQADEDFGTEEVPVEQLCYDIAYFLLPQYAYHRLDELAEMVRKAPRVAGLNLFVRAVMARKAKVRPEDAEGLRWHVGMLMDGLEHFILEYPPPPPFDLSEDEFIERMQSGSPPVLAPHFSAILHAVETGEAFYFVLGQAPLGGGTTLRCVTEDQKNCNLGPGPKPVLTAFVAKLRKVMEKAVDGA